MLGLIPAGFSEVRGVSSDARLVEVPALLARQYGYHVWSAEDVQLDLFTVGLLVVGRCYAGAVAWLLVPGQPALYCGDWAVERVGKK